MRRLAVSFFYLGYCPLVPGTAASVGAMAVYLLVASLPHGHFVMPLLVAAAGGLCLWLGEWAEEHFGVRDPRPFVLDEAAGFFVAVLGITPLSPGAAAIIALLFFRLFDITKPFPAWYVAKLPGGTGILMDDLVAGLYAHLCTRLVLALIGGA